MITRQGTDRRNIEVRVTEVEADALKAAGFNVKHNPMPHTWPGQPFVAWLNADERSQLRFARGVFGEPCAVDRSSTATAKELRLFAGRVERAEPGKARVDALLATPCWRGSHVQETTDSRGKRVFLLRHESGARATVYAEPL